MGKQARAWEVVIRLPHEFDVEIDDRMIECYFPCEIVIPFDTYDAAVGAAAGISVTARPGQPGIIQGEVIHDHDQQ